MRTMIFLLLANCIDAGVRAQSFNLSDSLRDVFKQRITPSFAFDTRNSFITGSTAKIYSIKAGIAFGTRLSVGVGYNFIGTELQEEFIRDGEWTQADIRMNYIAPYVQYSFYQRGPWEVSTPIQLGIGNSFLREENEAGVQVFNKSRVVIYEPGMAFEFKILKLIGVGAGFGYRIMLKNNRGIQQQFTSPLYALRCRLIFDEVYSRYKKYSQSETTAPTE